MVSRVPSDRTSGNEGPVELKAAEPRHTFSSPSVAALAAPAYCCEYCSDMTMRGCGNGRGARSGRRPVVPSWLGEANLGPTQRADLTRQHGTDHAASRSILAIDGMHHQYIVCHLKSCEL